MTENVDRFMAEAKRQIALEKKRLTAKSKDGLTAGEVVSLCSPGLFEALQDGSWYATGLRTPIDPDKRPERIPAYLWDVLEIDYTDNDASGGGVNYVRLRFYKGDVNVEPLEPAEAERRQLDKHPRKHNVEADALLKNRIKSVIAKAKNTWPDPETRPGATQMAQELVDGQPKRKVEGFGQEAIRKILAGTYKPAKERGIPGLSSW